MDTLDAIRTRLPELGFTDHLRALNALENEVASGKPLKVAVLRSYTVEPIEPVLKLRLVLQGYAPVFWFGGYNQYAQEVLDPRSGLYAFDPDVVLLLVRLDEILPDFLDRFAGRALTEWRRQLTQTANELADLAARVATTCAAQVLVQNLAIPGLPQLGVFDAQHGDGQHVLVQALNQQLAAEAARTPGVYIWDYAGLVALKGHDQLFDPKAWYVSRNPFRQTAYPAIAADVMRYLQSAIGPSKKCVVLDLDNTLWGGLAGEEGIDGVALGQAYPGNCYRDFQKGLLKLRDRGMLLALNSKNNEEEALRIIDRHPDMVLRREHFAAVRINWQDKATNLRELARELNLGFESLVFVDDNPAECDLIRRACPECDVVLLPDKPYLLPAVPLALPGIENLRLTQEDRAKSAMYQAESGRKQHQQQSASVEEFLRSLHIEVTISPATSFTLPRIVQLTQKTNQMNMTTRRYTEPQVLSLMRQPDWEVLSVATKDRFGDQGIVGVALVRFESSRCVIDTFLLSCRVIGRGIEEAMVAFIAESARARGVSCLVGEFVPTAKNAPAAGFYERIGFQKTTDVRFEADLRRVLLPVPDHLHAARAELDARSRTQADV